MYASGLSIESDVRSLLRHIRSEQSRIDAAVEKERERVVRHHVERARHYREMQRDHVEDDGHWGSYSALAFVHETSAAFFRSPTPVTEEGE